MPRKNFFSTLFLFQAAMIRELSAMTAPVIHLQPIDEAPTQNQVEDDKSNSCLATIQTQSEMVKPKLHEKLAPVSPSQMKVMLANAIENANIRIKPGFRAEVANMPSGSHWLTLLDKKILQIKKLLPETIPHALLTPILLDKDFSIELVAHNDAELTYNGAFLGVEARYMPLRNKIVIDCDTRKTDSEVLSTLRNELHHVAVRHKNFLLQKSPQTKLPAPEVSIQILRPFVKDLWVVDAHLSKQHRSALKAGLKRVDDFKYLLSQPDLLNSNHFLNKENKKKLSKWLTVLKNYKPLTYSMDIPIHMYESVQNVMQETNGVQTILLRNKLGYVISQYRESDVIILKYSFLKSEQIQDIAMAFINDIERYKRDMDGYSHLSEEDRSFELSSFLQEIDPSVLKIFFQEWCAYFSAYHDIEDYCTETGLSNSG